MYRYIALIWNASNTEAAESVRSIRQRFEKPGSPWLQAVDEEGLLILDTQGRADALHAYRLPARGGAILGKFFRKGDLETGEFSSTNMDENEAKKISHTGGRHLIDNYWGQYIAFLHNRESRSISILRDPTGSLMCFWMNHCGVHIFFSSVNDIADLGLFRFSVNWSHVARQMSNIAIRVADTGLNEVTEVLAGQRVQIQPSGQSLEFLWDPREIARTLCVEDPKKAAADLRKTVYGCVAAWASCYRTIILELSGGLDSSILLSCLKRIPDGPDVVCLNFFTTDKKGDERDFARMSALEAGCELIEQSLQAEDANIYNVLQGPRFANPTPYAYISATPYPDIFERVGREWNADGFFAGNGGDHLFHRSRTNLVAADFAYQHGLHPRLLTVAYDTTRLTGESLWSVLESALKLGVLKRQLRPYSGPGYLELRTFLSDAALEMCDFEQMLHPWLKQSNGVPPGKVQMIQDVIELNRQFWVTQRLENTDTIYPLVSQPLIELCIAIPNYLLTLGGRERGLARSAFADDIPHHVAGRHGKGTNAQFFNKFLTGNRAFVREFLLDGELAKQGLINRDVLELYLSAREMFRGDELVNLGTCFSTEAWARGWSDTSRRVAA